MEPPAADGNALSPMLPEQQPKTSIPKTVGIMNIVFGCLLLLCIAGCGFYVVVYATMGEAIMAMQQQQIQVALQGERLQVLQQLQEQEKASEDEKEKAELRAKQKAIEAQPLPKMPDFTKVLREGWFQGYIITDFVSGFVLNILMIVSGIGLVCSKEWGRVTGIWVAALKIIRLVAIYTFFSLAIVPLMAKDFTTMIQEFSDEIVKAAPPGRKGPGAGDLAQVGTVLGVVSTATAVGIVIFGAIYPIIVLILLTRPRVKAACAPPPAKIE